MRKAATVGALRQRRYHGRASHWLCTDWSGYHPSQAQPEKMRSPPGGGKHASKEPGGGRQRPTDRQETRRRAREREREREEKAEVEEEEEEEETTKKPSRSWFRALYRTASPACVWQPRPRVDSRVPPALGAAITVTKKPPFTLPPRPILSAPLRHPPDASARSRETRARSGFYPSYFLKVSPSGRWQRFWEI